MTVSFSPSRGHGHKQAPRRFAHVHSTTALPAARERRSELTTEEEIALDLGDPASQALGVGECRPQVVDVGVVAALQSSAGVPWLAQRRPG